MIITQKSRYGLRAVFELAKRFGQGPVKTCTIAQNQDIPQRFLEAILRELKQGGIVDSRRGSDGGYILIRPPEGLTVDEVLIVLQGPVDPISCVPIEGEAFPDCNLYGRCVFLSLWEETREAVQAIFQRTTFQGLLDNARASCLSAGESPGDESPA